MLLCRTVLDEVSSLVRKAGTVGEASLTSLAEDVCAILFNQSNSFFPFPTTEPREAVAINAENEIVSLFFLQLALRIVDQTYHEEKVTKFGKKKRCSSRCY